MAFVLGRLALSAVIYPYFSQLLRLCPVLWDICTYVVDSLFLAGTLVVPEIKHLVFCQSCRWFCLLQLPPWVYITNPPLSYMLLDVHFVGWPCCYMVGLLSSSFQTINFGISCLWVHSRWDFPTFMDEHPLVKLSAAYYGLSDLHCGMQGVLAGWNGCMSAWLCVAHQ